MQSEIIDRFAAFIRSEFERYDADDNNRVGVSLRQIERYLRFVEIARSRYLSISTKVAERFRKRMEDPARNPGTRVLTPEEIAEQQKDGQLNLHLHFEIESFFLFAMILLDKVAHFIGDYFGQVQRISFRSHDKLRKGIDQYSKAKHLQIPSGMTDSMIELRSLIKDYRDDYIAHLQNPRAVHGTRFAANDATQIDIETINWKEQDKQVSSPPIEHVCSVIERYMSQLESLIEMNRDKSRY